METSMIATSHDPCPASGERRCALSCELAAMNCGLRLDGSRGGSVCATLYDGHGKEVAVFPSPQPETKNYAQHADMLGNSREEIVVWNAEEIRVYGNGDPPPPWVTVPRSRPSDKHLYNYTYYIRMP